jgi:transposase
LAQSEVLGDFLEEKTFYVSVAHGLANRQISRELGIHYSAIDKTRTRFIKDYLGALKGRPRSGRKPTIGLEIKRHILSEVTHLRLLSPRLGGSSRKAFMYHT